MKQAEIGSISEGTLRTADLIPAFLDVLRGLVEIVDTDVLKRIREIEEAMDEDGYFDTEDAGFDLEDLYNLLDEAAPPYCYFGAHEGDSACFGFFYDEDAYREAVREGEVMQVEDTSYLDAALDRHVQEHDVPEYVAVVSDHGNLTLYRLKVDLGEEVWAIV